MKKDLKCKSRWRQINKYLVKCFNIVCFVHQQQTQIGERMSKVRTFFEDLIASQEYDVERDSL